MELFSKVNGGTGSLTPWVRSRMQVMKRMRELGLTRNVQVMEHLFHKILHILAIGKKALSMVWVLSRFLWTATSANIKVNTNSDLEMVKVLTNGRMAPRIKGIGKIT